MRYAILSDIHANLEAFRAVLARIEGLGADRMVCLGDVVGYNADPNACVDIMRDAEIASILGNHDAAACGIAEPDTFNPAARAAVLWTRDVLNEENRAYLRGLPRTLRVGSCILCHGSIGDTNRYILTKDDVHDVYADMDHMPGGLQVCFYGHTHVRDAYGMGIAGLSRLREDHIIMEDGVRYLINPGGVGQPRDGDPAAPFLLYDSEARTIDFHRVAYDIAACQDKVIRAGLPPRLAERLALGR